MASAISLMRAPRPSNETPNFVMSRPGVQIALAHIVKDRLDDLRVGARVKAVWAPDDERKGTIHDIACFQLVG